MILIHRDGAKAARPFGVVTGSLPDCVAALVRATSPTRAPFLADKPPVTITAGQYHGIWL